MVFEHLLMNSFHIFLQKYNDYKNIPLVIVIRFLTMVSRSSCRSRGGSGGSLKPLFETKLFHLYEYFFLNLGKGGITPEEDHEDLTTSWKIEGRSENVVKMKPFSGLQDHSTSSSRPYYVHTASLPGSYYVHQVSNEFLPRAYHTHPVYSTLTLRSQHDQADRTTRLPRFQHVLTAYSLLLYRTYFTFVLQ